MLIGGAIAPIATVAQAGTGSKLDAARHELARINAEVDAQTAQLADLRAESTSLASKTTTAEGALEEARSKLRGIEHRISITTARYEQLRARLSDRAVEMFMSSGSSLEVILGASSMSDLSDRVQYFSAVSSADASLSSQVANLRASLDIDRATQEQAVQARQQAYAVLQSQLRDLQDRFAQQQAIYDSIEQDRQQAESIVSDLRHQYQQELAAQVPDPPSTSTGSGSSEASGPNPFSVCPVGDPHALTDSFGAPRYGGGYHVHAGNDIMAPEGVPIYATFSGTATNASNALGGLAVVVTGAQGWTYNAHMVRIGRLGSVSAGDIIGYVGATGDTSTPHNHFEWHPNVIPGSWPSSPYGYSVVGDAVNPYPILVGVC